MRDFQERQPNDPQKYTNHRFFQTIEALALLHACKKSRLAALTSGNSSTVHLLAPSPPPSPEGARPPPRTMQSASLVHVVSHMTMTAAPAGSLAGQNQQTAQRPPLISRGSTKSILKTSLSSVPTLAGGTRRGSRMGSVVSWMVPSLGQIGEDGMTGSSADAGADAAGEELSLPPTPLVVEEDRVIGDPLVRMQTKVFRRMNYSSGEEEFEEILVNGARKQVVFVWGEGVDDIIT